MAWMSGHAVVFRVRIGRTGLLTPGTVIFSADVRHDSPAQSLPETAIWTLSCHAGPKESVAGVPWAIEIHNALSTTVARFDRGGTLRRL